MNELITKVERLKENYDQDVLLEVAKEYNDNLKADGFEVTMYYEAIWEVIDKLHEKQTTIDSILKEVAMTMEKYSEILKEIKSGKLIRRREITYRSIIDAPIFLLQVVYIWNHENYDGDIDTFAENGHNQKFSDAIGEG